MPVSLMRNHFLMAVYDPICVFWGEGRSCVLPTGVFWTAPLVRGGMWAAVAISAIIFSVLVEKVWNNT